MVDTEFRNRTSGAGVGTAAGTDWTEPVRHKEGPVARAIEERTARIPSDMYLWASFASMGVSLFLQLTGRKEESLFVGQWAPSFMLLGLYNKIVKVAGPDRLHAA